MRTPGGFSQAVSTASSAGVEDAQPVIGRPGQRLVACSGCGIRTDHPAVGRRDAWRCRAASQADVVDVSGTPPPSPRSSSSTASLAHVAAFAGLQRDQDLGTPGHTDVRGGIVVARTDPQPHVAAHTKCSLMLRVSAPGSSPAPRRAPGTRCRCPDRQAAAAAPTTAPIAGANCADDAPPARR